VSDTASLSSSSSSSFQIQQDHQDTRLGVPEVLQLAGVDSLQQSLHGLPARLEPSQRRTHPLLPQISVLDTAAPTAAQRVHLQTLEFLDLGDNSISALPPEVSLLTNLTFLRMSKNPLDSSPFPDELGTHATLCVSIFLLSFSPSLLTFRPCISFLPSPPMRPSDGAAGLLTKLTNLRLYSTGLPSVPPCVTRLVNLVRSPLPAPLCTKVLASLILTELRLHA